MTHKYPSNASSSFYHALGWYDVADTCRRIAAGKRPQPKMLQLRDSLEFLTKLSGVGLSDFGIDYLGGVEDIYIEAITNTYHPTQLENPADYWNFLQIDYVRWEDCCDLCGKRQRGLLHIYGGLAAEHFACQQECARKILARRVNEDVWLRRLRDRLISPPHIDFTLPTLEIGRRIMAISSDMEEYKPAPRFRTTEASGPNIHIIKGA